MKKEYTIDAADMTLGRVASKAAVLLRGKDAPAFERHIAPDVTVKIVNASKIKMHNSKLTEHYHRTYSGYPGSLVKTSWATTVKTKGYAELIRLAVHGMIPGNKLRPAIMKHLSIAE